MSSLSSWHWIVVLCLVAPMLGIIWYCAHLARVKGPTGVGGWLAWFVFLLAITSPLINLVVTAAVLGSVEASNPGLNRIEVWRSYKTAVWLTTFVLIGLQWWAAYLLTQRFVPSSVSIAKLVLAAGPLSILLNALLGFVIVGEVDGAATASAFFKATILALIWIAYLSESQRVKRTYGIEPQATSMRGPLGRNEADAITSSSPVWSIARDAAMVENSTLVAPSSRASLPADPASATKPAPADAGDFDLRSAYRTIAGEIESDMFDKGLWLEALVASGGETGPRREAAYASLRVEALRAVFEATASERRKAVVQTKYGVELVALQKSFTYNQPLTENGLEKLVKWAVETSNVDLQSPFSGETLLHLACERGFTRLVQILVKQGANQFLRNERGLTAREVAERSGQHAALMHV